MPKNENLTACLRAVVMAFACIATLSANAQSATTAQASPGVKSSIQTVDELLKIENNAVLAKSRPAASPMAARVAAPKPSAPSVNVESIYGTAGALKTDLIVNGMPHEGLRLGAKVGSCVVREIANSCVVLAPSSAKTAAAMCPKSCWTGEPKMMMGADSEGSGIPRGMTGQPMPMPVPLPMSSLLPRQPTPAPAVR